MNNKVLVVESKNGKVSQKYITKKEAQKTYVDGLFN
jgi:hypothetical protein